MFGAGRLVVMNQFEVVRSVFMAPSVTKSVTMTVVIFSNYKVS